MDIFEVVARDRCLNKICKWEYRAKNIADAKRQFRAFYGPGAFSLLDVRRKN